MLDCLFDEMVNGICFSVECPHPTETPTAYKRPWARIVTMKPTANEGLIGEALLLSSRPTIAWTIFCHTSSLQTQTHDKILMISPDETNLCIWRPHTMLIFRCILGLMRASRWPWGVFSLEWRCSRSQCVWVCQADNGSFCLGSVLKSP